MQAESGPVQREVLPIEEQIFKGIKQRLQEVFAAQIIFANSTDEIQALRKIQQSKEGVKYPYIFFSISNLTRTQDSWRSLPFIRRGVDAFITADNNMVYKVSVIPVDMNCEIVYRHNDFDKVKEFAKRWLMSIQGGWLKFTVQYGRVLFPIHITLSDDIPVPKREANTENIQEWVLTTNLIIKGWMSERMLREQQAAKEVDIEAYIGDLTTQQEEEPNIDVQTFKFTNTPTLE